MKNRILNMIFDRLQGKPFLEPVETSVCKIPEYLQLLDPDVFVVFNKKPCHYEVHSLANRGNTYRFTVPWDVLDERTIELFRKYDHRTRSIESIVREIDRHNEVLERRDDAQRRGEVKAWALENRSRFKRFAEEVY